jgi:hypothetical protein
MGGRLAGPWTPWLVPAGLWRRCATAQERRATFGGGGRGRRFQRHANGARL